MSAGALEPALVQVAGRYERSGGHPVQIQFGTAPELARRLAAGERAEILIAPATVVSQAVRENRVVGSTQAVVGRVGVGITVRRGAWLPDVGTVESLRRALLEADAVVFNRASTGLYVEQLLVRLELSDRLRPKTIRYHSGAEVLDHVVRGTGRDMGLAALTEIREYESRGLTLVGPLPGDVQHYTTYVAVVMAGAARADVAAGFIAYLTTPEARQVFAATGVQ
jgi:molybdate transport system substrate-binding protein